MSGFWKYWFYGQFIPAPKDIDPTCFSAGPLLPCLPTHLQAAGGPELLAPRNFCRGRLHSTLFSSVPGDSSLRDARQSQCPQVIGTEREGQRVA